MNDGPPKKDATSEERIEVGFFSPEDAEGITALFRSVYGEGYPIRVFYDPQALTEANEKGTYYSIVARNVSGEILGAQHLFRSAPYDALYELGAGLVSKKYRKLGLNKRLLDFVYEEWVPMQRGIEEIWGEPVCNHLTMQKAVVEFRHVVMGLEVALMPSEAYDREKSAAGRVAALTAFRCYKPKPHTVYLPPAYEQELRFLYSELDDNRDILISDQSLPDSIRSQGDMAVFDFAKVCRIAVPTIGADFETHINDLENRALEQQVVAIQVWLNLGCPWVGAAVDILREKGYFLGGLLPRWFDDDGLLMQKIMIAPDFDSIQLYSDRSKELFAMIQADWRRTQER